MNKLKKKFIKSRLKKRNAHSHKGDHGHALLIAGQKGYMGAAVIAAKAAMRTGLGLLTVSVPSDERLVLQVALPEAMLVPRAANQLNMDKYAAVGIGPGLGTNKESENLLAAALTGVRQPMLLDADALNIISGNKKLMAAIPAGTVITPHVIEFDRLFGIHQNNDERIATAIEKARELHIIIVLKGPETAIISEEEILYNTTGNAGLAKGGSGDALTGVITSLLAQGYAPFTAACIGVYMHGLAADLSLKHQSMESVLITDIIDHFGKAFKKIWG
ncbi:MAG: NAD(P)H-hydrate dehydratase [Taibaiella sp.]|nr:NAD(P)H-hydrate dehydratase [Taibaiella sp.]